MTAHPALGALPPPGPHGGDGAAVAAALGLDPADVLDLSASLNPFAPDLRPLLAPHLAAGVLARYPDDRPATSALADALGVPPERVVLTNGGAEAIALVAQLRPHGWVEDPEFACYRRHLASVVPGAPRWRSNPHSPSGRLAPPDARASVWDEAFWPLATGTWTRGDAEHGAIVLGSLTKLLACPGLRAGYVLAPDPDLAAAVAARRPTWSCNGLVAAALPRLLDLVDLPGWSTALADTRRQLADLLRAHGWRPRPSEANWLLVDDAAGLRSALAHEGVVVRDCTSFGLPDTVRIAVPGPAGLDRLDRALARIAGAGGGGGVGHGARVGPDAGPRSPARDRVSPQRRAGRGPGAVKGALLVCGTGSDAGKSAVVTGLCRLLARRGLRVAPFKGQNMALNSWVTDDGAEIGRAQAVQALAAGIPPEARMNPVLLKPTGERTSQVVVLGRPWTTLDAKQYHAAKALLRPVVLDALTELRARVDLVICEGAGSPAEINLLDGDLVNLGLASAVGMPAIVVGDIDRGGVFAACYGTVALLPDDLRRLVRGFCINKFRGDPALLQPGLAQLEARTGIPVLGVLPHLSGLDLDAEDSLALDRPRLDGPLPRSATARSTPCGLDVAVIRFPRIANATDLDPLDGHPDVRVRLVEHPAALGDPDLVVLPGTKATVGDLGWLRSTGLADALIQLLTRAEPVPPIVLGICGGYQMLGRRIHDEVESGRGSVPGLGLLPLETRFHPDKRTRRRSGFLVGGSRDTPRVAGYEIHHGLPRPDPAPGISAKSGPDSGPEPRARPWFELDDRWGQEPEGLVVEHAGRYGTSLHGLFEDDAFRHGFLAMVARRRGRPVPASGPSFPARRQARFDLLADALEAHVDVDALLDLAAGARPLTAEASRP